MRIDIITAFPKIVESPLNESIIKVGRRKERVDINIHDLRAFTGDKHRTVDDYPYGGGPGMVLKIEPVIKALDAVFEKQSPEEAQIVLTSPRGRTFNQSEATQFSLQQHLVILCGHYKGIDERVHAFYPIDEISIGDYVLSSGEVAALVIVDTIVRLLPGVINDIDSAFTDSFSDHLLDAPCYTRPEVFRGRSVPDVLLSGDHKKIEQWRLDMRKKLTKERRPDLFEKYRNQ